MKKINPVILWIIILTILAITGIIVAIFYSGSGTQAPVYSITDQERPKLEISEKKFDFGNIKVSDKKTKDIAIKNNGTKPLALNNFSSSCNCTFIQVVINEEKSPEFNMHSNSRWQKELQPNQTATLKITYQPSLMPVEGSVSRTAFFKTNDPENPEVNIEFNALVE